MIKKLLCLLVLLLTATTGAWATPNSIVINGTPQVGDKSISLTYHFDPANVTGIQQYVPTLKVKCAADNKWDEMNLSLSDVSSGTTNISLNTLGKFEAGKTYEVCFAYYNGTWVDDVFQSFVPAGPVTYAITLKEDTEEFDKWTISPTEAAEGTTVTATYSGSKKVKSVKAVKAATDLSKLTAAYTAQDGEILTGTTSQEISIAEGATVTLKNATVNNRIKCLGTATIILADGSTNAVKASDYCAGIQIGGEGTTLTINAETAGTGSLTATGGDQAAGIGTGSTSTSAVTGGNIVINGGTITANAGTRYGAGIGTGLANSHNNTCGSITINGGTVTATGGAGGSGIGTGTVNEATNTCGAISITGGTVTANKGSSSGTFYSIGIGKVLNNGTQTCGTITIGGVVTGNITTSPYIYQPSN